jgi:hypothetical protein
VGLGGLGLGLGRGLGGGLFRGHAGPSVG